MLFSKGYSLKNICKLYKRFCGVEANTTPCFANFCVAVFLQFSHTRILTARHEIVIYEISFEDKPKFMPYTILFVYVL